MELYAQSALYAMAMDFCRRQRHAIGLSETYCIDKHVTLDFAIFDVFRFTANCFDEFYTLSVWMVYDCPSVKIA